MRAWTTPDGPPTCTAFLKEAVSVAVKVGVMYRMFLFTCVLSPLLFTFAAPAQVLPAWAARHDAGAGGADTAFALKVDSAGNTYVTGDGVAVAGDQPDIVTVKYAPDGTQLWAARYDNPGSDTSRALAIDPAGNVYVLGNLFETNANILTIKYNSAGVQEWARRYDSGMPDWAFTLTADSLGNVYVAAFLSYTNSSSDVLIIKYDTAGEILWSRTYSAPGALNNQPGAIAVDSAGNVHVTGDSDAGSPLRLSSTPMATLCGRLLICRPRIRRGP
jgi:hypothetical protein